MAVRTTPPIHNDDLIVKERSLVQWRAPSRPFKRFRREFYINLGAIFVLFGLILFIIEGIIPAILVASIFFIFYVFTTIPPAQADYKITTYGIIIGLDRIEWDMFGRYWFSRRFDSDILVVETHNAPWKLEMVIDSKVKTQIESHISKYLYLNDTPPNYMDKATNWVASRLRF